MRCASDARAVLKSLKRWIFLLHRWLGIALGLLFLLWFASGIVMMYVPYPALTDSERLGALADLEPEHIKVPLAQVLADLPGAGTLESLTISTLLGRPVYRLKVGGERFTVFADDGSHFTGLRPGEAEQVANRFRPGSPAVHLGQIHMDQWTVSGGLNALRPLHKVGLEDERGTVVYVSQVSGELVRDTTVRERAWNWVGSTVHWLYPMQLRRHPGAWANVVIYLSVAGMLVLVTGVFAGVQRLRLRRRYRGGRTTPYTGWQKWHHLLGLLTAVFLCTFLFSGLLSMNPWGVFDNRTSPREQIQRYTGGPLQAAGAQEILAHLARSPRAGGIKELEWAQLSGQGYFIARAVPGEARLLLGGTRDTEAFAAHIRAAVPRLLPDAAIRSWKLLSSSDNYYYSRHHRQRPLPVYRVEFADEARTWFHIDPATGQVLNRLTATDRVQRWLYNGLHSLDFHALLTRRPLWDLVMIVLNVAGIFVSCTAIVLAARRTRLWWRQRSARRSRPPASLHQSPAPISD
ncbi:PepSY domain-containing protein [Gilvimarinus sp. F26214L]|uniref:PepSY domain-containing protein n=1 Tax=Gilvimarinus sp. DZF01 TaxID=3461371 RepID=UPI0040452425